jgi:hypothetical protein
MGSAWRLGKGQKNCKRNVYTYLKLEINVCSYYNNFEKQLHALTVSASYVSNGHVSSKPHFYSDEKGFVLQWKMSTQ